MEFDLCQICLGQSNPYNNPALICKGNCNAKIHISCLKRGALPSNFIGDVFYDLYCTTCSESNAELLMRQKLPWLTTVILTLYNLREKSNGISRRGYFHWKSDISTFINNNWDQLFGKTVKRKKNWVGTISGTLSHYSGLIFKSGTAELGDQGWWKLIDNDPPEVLVNKYNEEKKQNQTKLKAKSTNNSKLVSNVCFADEYSNGIENCKSEEIKSSVVELKEEIKPDNNISTCFPTTCDELGGILDLDLEMPNIEDYSSFDLTSNIIKEVNLENCNELPDVFESNYFPDFDIIKDENFEDIDVIDTPDSASIQDPYDDLKVDDSKETSPEPSKCNENDRVYDLPPPVPSLFTQSEQRPWPWDETIKLNPDDIRPLMTEREEEYLLQKIEQYKHLLDTAPPTVRRLYRKLAVRKLKRQYGLPILNIDTFGNQLKEGIPSQNKKKGNIVLDRFISEDTSIFFEQRLQGHCQPTSVHSPYTNRLLKPYIRRDTVCRPLWLKVMNELLAKVNSNKENWKPRPPVPIDYSYVRPQHIPAMNSLCTQFFWPGVDLTECLQYPDFTCVVLYKKVIIGFAIMIPDVGYNEAYISFLLVRPEWQNAGIGTFMLYHLIQTCMGKDITLHVSATNSALILYQKFGFKQEEFIQDFYDKYILPSSKESKHAIFLRLSR